jgi:predicted transcriptional regulator
LGLAFLGAIAVILQLIGVVNLLTQLTEIFIWIAAAVIGVCFGLITKGGTWKEGKITLKPEGATAQVPNETQAIPKRETLRRFVNELSVLEQAQGYFPSSIPTISISHLTKLNHQTVLEICRDLGKREWLEVKEMNGHALVRITARGQNILKEAG